MHISSEKLIIMSFHARVTSMTNAEASKWVQLCAV